MTLHLHFSWAGILFFVVNGFVWALGLRQIRYQLWPLVGAGLGTLSVAVLALWQSEALLNTAVSRQLLMAAFTTPFAAMWLAVMIGVEYMVENRRGLLTSATTCE